MALPELSLAFAPSASSGTGSDIFDNQSPVSFGAISVGGSASANSFMESLIRDAALAVSVALILKIVLGKK